MKQSEWLEHELKKKEAQLSIIQLQIKALEDKIKEIKKGE